MPIVTGDLQVCERLALVRAVRFLREKRKQK